MKGYFMTEQLERFLSSSSHDSFNDFIELIFSYPSGNIEKNLALFLKYGAGSKDAKDELILSNGRLILSRASFYKKKFLGAELCDLFQMGVLGFMRALESYNPDKGALSTYAVKYIDSQIRRDCINSGYVIRKPVFLETAIERYNRIASECEKSSKDMPSDEELMDILNISAKSLKVCKENYKLNALSLNFKLDDENGTELEDILLASSLRDDQYSKVLNEITNRELLVYLKHRFPADEYYVIYHTILADERRTDVDIGNEFHVKSQTINQMKQKVLKILRRIMNSYGYNMILQDLRKTCRIEFYNLNPVELDDVLKYLWMRDAFSDEEKKVYKAIVFREYDYSDEVIASNLGLDLNEYMSIKNGITNKLAVSLKEHHYEFIEFKNMLLDQYGIELLALGVDSIVISRQTSEDITSNLTKAC